MIREDLQEFYASGPEGVFSELGVSFYHPAFSQNWHLTNWAEMDEPEVEYHAFNGVVRGRVERFLTHPMEISLPTQNVSGGQRLRVTLRHSGSIMSQEIFAAAKTPHTPIEVQVDSFIIGSLQSQDDSFAFLGKQVSFSASAVTIEAGGSDVLNQPYLRQRFVGETNPGLLR